MTITLDEDEVVEVPAEMERAWQAQEHARPPLADYRERLRNASRGSRLTQADIDERDDEDFIERSQTLNALIARMIRRAA